MPIETAAALVISEIMYNPASDEGSPVQTEWVEIYNPTQEAIDLTGWYLQDEDGRTQGVAGKITIDPSEAVVFIPSDQTVADFHAAWGDGIKVVPLADWQTGLRGLANSPSDTNEHLALHRPDESVSDAVNYDDVDPWPNDGRGGASIYLLPNHIDAAANDAGANWANSEATVHGARYAQATTDYDARDVGSPGSVVVTETAAE